MKLKLTPLNILTSVLLVALGYLIIYPDTEDWRLLGSMPLLILAVLSFITDLIFRKHLKYLKRIWIIETVFIIFAAILIILFRHVNQSA